MIDSSPTSAESSFRELDEVFLQTQTRIWVGELLNIRLNEDLALSDLLQDGEILFEVSKVVWDLLLTKCIELRHLKHKYGPFRSKKSSGRYRPYSNVDSFLKICKILGLSGIDLFSPSDVVEKRDIRKVCICMRALSKKARSKQLSVPDFDMVIYSVTMPTDMVGVIRKSLESSQRTFSSSSSYGSRKGSHVKLEQKNLYAPPNGNDDSSSSDESDEAESRYMGENSFSSASKLEYGDGINSYSENSLERHPKLHCDIPDISSEERNNCKNDNVDVSNTNFAVENDNSYVEDSSCIGVGQNNYISDYLAFSDLMVHATDGTNPIVLDGENNMFDFFLNVDSQKVTSDKRGFHNGIYSDDEDMEVSSTTSMSSVLGRLLNLELDNQFDEDESSSTNVQFPVPEDHESGTNYKDLFVANDNQEAPHFSEVKEKDTVGITMLGSDTSQGFNSQDSPLVYYYTNTRSSIIRTNLSETTAENHPHLPVVAQEGTEVAENCSQDNSEGIKDTSNPQSPPRKHNRRPLLKTVVKGTAIAGVLFLLLHISKSRGNTAQETTFSGAKASSTKQQQTRRVGKGIYPTENIKLGK